MTIPAGRPIREALDAMIEGFCEHHLALTFEELEPADQAELLHQLQVAVRMRQTRVDRTIRRKARVGHSL